MHPSAAPTLKFAENVWLGANVFDWFCRATMLVFTPRVPEVVNVPPIMDPSVATLVTVPCGTGMHWLVTPEADVVTFWAASVPVQVAVPFLAMVALSKRAIM